MSIFDKIINSIGERVDNQSYREGAVGWRPMFMKPYPGQKNKQLAAQKAVAFFHPLNHLMRVSCTMKEMVDAMHNVATNGYRRNNIESWDIIRCARNLR